MIKTMADFSELKGEGKRELRENRDKPELKQHMLALEPYLKAFAAKLCGDPERARDLVQETYLKAWAALRSFKPGTNMRAWMFAILRNTYFSDARHRRREKTMDPDVVKVLLDERVRLHDRADQEWHLDLVDYKQALSRLKPEQREVLELTGYGFSYEEIAVMCGLAEGTVRSRINRTRKKLQKLMGQETERLLSKTPADDAHLPTHVGLEDVAKHLDDVELPGGERKVGELIARKGLSGADVAAALDLTPETVNRYFHRVKTKIRVLLGRNQARATSPEQSPIAGQVPDEL